MKSLFLLAMVSIALSAQAWAQVPNHSKRKSARPVVLSTYGSAYGLQTYILADVVDTKDAVEVRIKSIKMKLSEHCPYKGPRKFLAMKVGLASSDGKAGWRFLTKSELQIFNQMILPGKETVLGAVKFTVPKQRQNRGIPYWIAVQVEEESPIGAKMKGFSFLHSKGFSCEDYVF